MRRINDQGLLLLTAFLTLDLLASLVKYVPADVLIACLRVGQIFIFSVWVGLLTYRWLRRPR